MSDSSERNRDWRSLAAQSQWSFPPEHILPPHQDAVITGADLEPSTVLQAYSAGFFPMPAREPTHPEQASKNTGAATQPSWWSPGVRGVLNPLVFYPSRSLRRSLRRFRTTMDEDFAAVIKHCAQVPRPGGWITLDIERAYLRLHDLGFAHSVEVWDEHDRLVGGLYGLELGGLFAGESMFHLVTDASKVAFAALVERLGQDGHLARMLDTQWPTQHLETLGVEALSRREYLQKISTAVSLPPILSKF